MGNIVTRERIPEGNRGSRLTEEKSQRDQLKIFRHDILQRGLTASMTFKGAAYIIAAVLVPTLGS